MDHISQKAELKLLQAIRQELYQNNFDDHNQQDAIRLIFQSKMEICNEAFQFELGKILLRSLATGKSCAIVADNPSAFFEFVINSKKPRLIQQHASMPKTWRNLHAQITCANTMHGASENISIPKHCSIKNFTRQFVKIIMTCNI